MKKRSLAGIIVVCIIVALLGFVIINGFDVGVYEVRPLNGIQQGIDLKGGVTTIYQAKDTSVDEFDSKMNEAVKVLRQRLDSKGLADSTVVRQGSEEIRVEMPINETTAIKSADDVISFLNKPANIEFVGPDEEVILDGSNITEAKAVVNSQTGQYYVDVKINSEGIRKLNDKKAELLDKQVVIKLDGTQISTITVSETTPIKSAYQLGGSYTLQKAQELAMQIKSGALPIELEKTEMRDTTPALGEGTLKSIAIAILIGVAVLFLFLLVSYRIPGFVICLSLLFYGCFTLLFIGSVADLKVTLPLLAGLALGLGMTVYANIQIFEQFKEEFRSGKTLRTSFNLGYQRALPTVFDSNIVILICAIVFALLGSWPMKSFGFMMIVSIISSMVSSLLITKGIFQMFMNLNIKNLNVYMKKATQTHLSSGAAKEGGDE